MKNKVETKIHKKHKVDFIILVTVIILLSTLTLGVCLSIVDFFI